MQTNAHDARRRRSTVVPRGWPLVFFGVFAGPSARACPVCSSETGALVRAALFGPELGWNAAATVFPFLVMFTLVAWFQWRGPAALRPPEDPR